MNKFFERKSCEFGESLSNRVDNSKEENQLSWADELAKRSIRHAQILEQKKEVPIRWPHGAKIIFKRSRETTILQLVSNFYPEYFNF
jgi:hypothetical protein